MAMNFDNQTIQITSQGEPDFRKALSFFFRSPIDVVKFYSVSESHGLILYWAECNDAKPLPFVMAEKAAADFAWNWLQQADYPPEPDHDGENGKAFQIYNEAWTHVNGRWEARVGIRPVWAMFGK